MLAPCSPLERWQASNTTLLTDQTFVLILRPTTELSCLLRSWVYLTPEESFLTGKFLEHTWAMIFGEPAVLMPVPECELLDCNVHGGQQQIHGFSMGAAETSS